MNEFQKNLFDKIEQSANVNAQDIFSIVDDVQNADFSNESTVRNLVRQLSALTNRPVSIEQEDRIVDAIVNNQENSDFASLKNLFDQS